MLHIDTSVMRPLKVSSPLLPDIDTAWVIAIMISLLPSGGFRLLNLKSF